ncbi:MAG: hypothetical protein A2W05_09495 [Candidatus Schekmanbacteria bacterium RBG_16_38_10]|uniref:Uncharacterized protein n=1 Tax=Candidatus Schekmanbacteria bacterium RBG_16_38_10 TaxID=1817879 RepID=A0A1F7RSU8_9BACT|nr:MAG: hypothetical protein A2W05_09495 [Candidatus Schekmanbacteria bacterium RBG_16_38_10]
MSAFKPVKSLKKILRLTKRHNFINAKPYKSSLCSSNFSYFLSIHFFNNFLIAFYHKRIFIYSVDGVLNNLLLGDVL